MLSLLSAAALVGIDALKVEVETNVSGGLPSFTIFFLLTYTLHRQPIMNRIFLD